MTPHARKWLSRIVRLTVTAAAVVYLYTKVAWYDQATLAADPAKSCRIVGIPAADPLQLEDPSTGRRFTATASELATPAQTAPLNKHPIEYGLRSIVRRMNVGYALLALLAVGPTTFILGWRLRYLLAMQHIEMSRTEAILLTFAGNFFNFALPGTTGGDLYKAYHIARHAHKRTEGVTVVFLDRAIGLISFVLLASLCILASWRTQALGRLGKLVGLMMAALFVGAAIFFSRRFRRWIGYEALLARLPMADRLKRVDQTAFNFRYHPRQTAVALLVTAASHAFLALGVMYFARSVGMPRPRMFDSHGMGEFYLACMLALTVGYLLAAVPISFQGFGLLEAVFLRVLAVGGWGTNSQVIAVCLGARVIQLIWSLPGIVVPWLGLRRPTAKEQEATEEAAGPSDESVRADCRVA